MPTVPYISQPRVGLNPLPNARVSPNAPIEAFGGGIAAQQPDLSGPANVAGQVSEQNAQERQRIRSEAALEADQVAVTHATSAVQNGVNDFMHGPNGLLNTKGSHAFTIDQDAYDQYGKLVADTRAQLTTDRQRAVFDKYAYNGWDAILSQVTPHIAQQREAFDKAGVQSALQANLDSAVANPENPVVVEQAVRTNQAVARARAQRLGLPEDAVNNAGAEAGSEVHLEVIKSMLSSPTNPNRDVMAAAYYDKNKLDLVGKDKLEAERLTKTSLMEGNALRTADKILATTASETAAYAETDKQIDDPVLREKANQHISAVYNRRQGAVQADQKAAYERGATILHTHGGDITSIPMTVRESMGEAHYQNLENEAWRLTHTRDEGDPEQYNLLVNMANFQKDAFNKTDLTKVPGLSQQQIHTLQTIQRGSINSDVRMSESDLLRDLTRSQAEERRYRYAAERATDPADKAAFEDQQVQANKQSTLIQSDLTALKLRARGTPIQPSPTPTIPPTAPPSVSPSTAAPTPAPTPASVPRSPPIALTPLKTPPASMAADIIQARLDGEHGAGYLNSLRTLGWDVDAVKMPVPVQAPPVPVKAPAKIEVKRDTAGRPSTYIITKPE